MPATANAQTYLNCYPFYVIFHCQQRLYLESRPDLCYINGKQNYFYTL
jgi:hypothetical protein